LHALDFFVNDILVILFSLSDIILDILVCLQFYKHSQMLYFYISVSIFIVAQLTYGFLFVATWGKHLPPSRQMAVFAAIIPFGQFVPIFTWVESFRFEWLDSLITSAGLTPTADPLTEDDADAAAEGDMLWGYIQSKYQSHAGFLAETLAEAIPQCMLQTVAIISTGQASPLFVVSILTSIAVIASKGYLISYSINRPTFLFNFICIVADVFGLFSILAWLFDDSNGGASHPLNRAYVGLLVGGWALLALGGLCLVIFSIFDDHLKDKHFGHRNIPDQRQISFLYMAGVRCLAWLLAVTPVCIVFLTTKLTLLPICVFKSLDPEHAQRWLFYNMLYKFLSLHKTDVRVVVANRFLAQCTRDKWRLVNELNGYAVNREAGGRLRSREGKIEQERIALQTWLCRVGHFKAPEPTPGFVTTIETEAEEPFDLDRILTLDAGGQSEARARSRLRRALLTQGLEARLEGVKQTLARRSALFRMLFYSQHGDVTVAFTCADKLMCAIGIACMVVGLLCIALFVPVFLVFVCYAMAYPVIQLVYHFVQSNPISGVAFALTVIYVALLVLLVLLGPVVYSFQSLRVDIIDIKHFPGIFYEKPTIQELHNRFVRDIDTRAVEKYMDAKFGRDMVGEIKSFLVDGQICSIA
jgi:hypothetical protein